MAAKVRILLVEDEALIAFDLKRRLLRSGYEVSAVVATGEAALTSEESERPDLVLMDNMLAGELGGFEAARQIRQKRDVAIILTTGYDFGDFADLIGLIRPLACLSKPIRFEELEALIGAAFPN